ncbi:hypothetical protein [Methylosinus sp. PW1]|uniref:hypothetical protein n=1 Tax=Methylosinus sp. PW1 TaxID=107636 RepID=UPI0012EC1C6A|nr:hypothetical protein [Methylosinus sp. PW1]
MREKAVDHSLGREARRDAGRIVGELGVQRVVGQQAFDLPREIAAVPASKDAEALDAALKARGYQVWRALMNFYVQPLRRSTPSVRISNDVLATLSCCGMDGSHRGCDLLWTHPTRRWRAALVWKHNNSTFDGDAAYIVV